MHFYLILFCVLIVNSNSEQLFFLQQTVILSRHNVRTPLSKNLTQVTPKPWPEWKEKSGQLTAKCALLEGFMGDYFSTWLTKEGLLPDDCPTEEVFYAYANVAQRTMASAKAFVNKAFPLCNISIHHADKSDPIFNPIIHNTSLIYIRNALKQMKDHLDELQLKSSYVNLERILSYKQSKNCVNNHKCNLVTDKNEATLKVGAKPNVSGPLKISKSVIDSFIMENYEGFNIDKVAWGNLVDEKQWKSVLDLSRGYHNVIFNITLIAKDISKPLLQYLSGIFLNESMVPKVLLIMGHDANMYTIINSMRFEPYTLKNQYEVIPIGGKIVFQKWADTNGKCFLKIDYVYQTTEQMRNGVPLSLKNPPQFQLLQLKGCKIDKNGFCLWDDFKRILQNF